MTLHRNCIPPVEAIISIKEDVKGRFSSSSSSSSSNGSSSSSSREFTLALFLPKS